MVIPRVWAAAAGPSTRGFMCIGCLQRKLGRPLRSTDFTAAPVNNPDHPWKTPRLREAMLRD